MIVAFGASFVHTRVMATRTSRKSKRPAARKRVVAKRRTALRNGKRSVTIERFEKEGWMVKTAGDQFMLGDTDVVNTAEALQYALDLAKAYLLYTPADFDAFVEDEGFEDTRW